MKKLIFAVAVMIITGFMMVAPAIISNPVFADEHCVNTAVLGDGGKACDNGGGSSIVDILQLIINILSVLIGVLAAIGVAVTGVQYLTAGGNEEKTRKAKRRLFEIVIGVAAYVLLYVFLNWLIPSFNGTGSGN